MEKCTNCGNEFEGRYCHHCGQEKVKRLQVKTIIHDVTHGILHWENSLLKTCKSLILRPGVTAREYISGKRKSYVKPFSYFIFIQSLYVIVFHRMSEKYFAFLNYTVTGDSSRVKDQAMEIQHIVSDYINYLNYFMPIVLAYFFYLFFRKKTGINYAEALAAAFYWAGTTLVFSIVLMLLGAIDIRFWNLRFFVNQVYYIIAVKTFYELSLFKGIVKGVFITFLSYLFFVISIIIGALLYLYFVAGINIFSPST